MHRRSHSRTAVDRVNRAVAGALGRACVESGDLILVALSGGPDSVALMHALLAHQSRFGFRLHAAHLNHALRGVESDRDECFVRDLCAKIGVPLVVERVVCLNSSSPNLEERARQIRHSFLNRTADSLGVRFIALGHHADDQAETVLMRMMRGSGAAGLAGMKEHRPGRLFRPMLTVTRADLHAYLSACGASAVFDTTNESGPMLRNRLRSDLLPRIEREYAPGFSSHLVELASELGELDDFVNAAASKELSARVRGSRLDVSRFGDLHPALAASVIRGFMRLRLASLRGIYRVHVREAVKLCTAGRSGGIAVLPHGWHIRREFDTCVLERTSKADARPFEIRFLQPGVTVVEPSGILIFSEIHPQPQDSRKWTHLGKDEAAFDRARIEGDVAVRVFRAGDRIRPMGMAGTRKVHDVLIDHKIPAPARKTWPLLTDSNEILWIPGLVRSRKALVSEETREILSLRALAPPSAAGVAPTARELDGSLLVK